MAGFFRFADFFVAFAFAFAFTGLVVAFFFVAFFRVRILAFGTFFAARFADFFMIGTPGFRVKITSFYLNHSISAVEKFLVSTRHVSRDMRTKDQPG